MLTQKEIFVLTGGGHKGSVKIAPVQNGKNTVKVECNLDFRPNNATLYIIGDEIAQMALKDSKTTCEVRFSSNFVNGCIVRSSAQTLFGGRGNKNEMLAKIGALTHQNQINNDPQTDTKTSLKNTTQQSDNCELKTKTNMPTTNNSSSQNNSSNLAELLSQTSNNSGILKYNGSNFYLAIKPQLDEMFVCYKQEETLNKTVENSSWVRIDTDDGYYVVGLLKDGDTPSYICYGVPSYNQNDVPPELKNVCVWLPVDDKNVIGYWVIYQSAVNGDIIK